MTSAHERQGPPHHQVPQGHQRVLPQAPHRPHLGQELQLERRPAHLPQGRLIEYSFVREAPAVYRRGLVYARPACQKPHPPRHARPKCSNEPAHRKLLHVLVQPHSHLPPPPLIRTQPHHPLNPHAPTSPRRHPRLRLSMPSDRLRYLSLHQHGDPFRLSLHLYHLPERVHRCWEHRQVTPPRRPHSGSSPYLNPKKPPLCAAQLLFHLTPMRSIPPHHHKLRLYPLRLQPADRLPNPHRSGMFFSTLTLPTRQHTHPHRLRPDLESTDFKFPDFLFLSFSRPELSARPPPSPRLPRFHHCGETPPP